MPRKPLRSWIPRIERLADRITPFTTSFSNGVLTVTRDFSSPPVTVSHNGSDILLNGNLIAGSPTLTNTTAINITGTPLSILSTIVIDESNGLFVSGGTNEIKFGLDGGTGTIDELVIRGVDGADDTIDLGAAGIDLNGDGDVDVTLAKLEQFVISGQGGNDRINASASGLAGGTRADGPFLFNLFLDGGDGTDVLIGGAGDDILCGGLGNDNLDGADGLDLVFEFADVNFVLTNTSLSGLGVDTLASIEQGQLFGGASNNLIDASAFSAGSVFLFGDTGDDTLMGGTNDDILGVLEDKDDDSQDKEDKGIGNDLLCGGLGDDQLFGGEGTDQVMETADTDFSLSDTSLIGVGHDTIGTMEQASLAGGASANVFTVTGFTGAATLDGGTGTDRVVTARDADFTLTTETVPAAASGGRADPASQSRVLLTQSTGGSFVMFNVLEAVLKGSSRNNTFTINDFTGSVTVKGGLGTDRIVVHADANLTLTNSLMESDGSEFYFFKSIERIAISGGAGDNVINAAAFTLGPVTLHGGAGNDSIRGSGFNDSLSGGDGNDTLLGLGGADRLNAGDGDDLVKGNAGADTLLGGLGNDSLLGGGAADFLDGDDGQDTADGGLGNDRCAEAESTVSCS